MKKQITLKAVKEAENMTGFDLQHFGNLPTSASQDCQRAALIKDKEWWELHVIDIYTAIEEVLKTIKTLDDHLITQRLGMRKT